MLLQGRMDARTNVTGSCRTCLQTSLPSTFVTLFAD